MRKHIYLHFSNLDQLRELRNDDKFERPPEYYEWVGVQKAFRNEYGRIRTNQNYYHILVGHLEQDGCPWCGSPAEVVKLGNSRVLGFKTYCIQCIQCGSRGPTLNVSETSIENTEIFQDCMERLWHRYKHRRTWDDGFQNPYESITE